ncbi:choice-of-anchor D domain-containing protein [Myxococcota bacterium]|nr:choice-of-anchor D domain-containing protein [Myxococcota bacterium]
MTILTSRSLSTLLIGLLGAHAVACQDDTGTIKQLEAKMEIDPLSLDFGRVQVGTTAQREIFIRNTGEAVLSLSGVVPGAAFDEAFAFEIDRTAIPPSGLATVRITFSPTDVGVRTAKLVVKSNDAKIDDAELSLTAEGVATTVEIDPKVLSFGNVVIQSTKTLPLTLRNTTDLEATIEYIDGLNVKLCTSGAADPSTFCIASRDRPIGADSRFTLPAGAETTLEVQFRPTVAGNRERASFTLKSCNLPVCETEIQLDGIGIEQGFRCTPPSLDFALVNPGSCATKNVLCENIANEQVTVLGWAVGAQGGSTPSTEFTLQTPAVQVLQQGDTLSIDATYCPTDLGNDRATIEIETDNRDPRLRYSIINIEGSGGGPNIAVFPAQLNFGLVSLIAPARKTFTIQNVGYAELAVSDILADTMGSGSFTTPGAGAQRIPVGGFYDVTVEFQPVQAGPINDEILIRSDDQDTPELRVPVAGEGINLPPCSFEVTPPQVSFGVVERSRVLSRSFEIRNTGANDCLVTSMRLLPGSDGEFSLPDGEVNSLIIPGNSSTAFRVQYAPTAVGDNVGTIEFSISSPTSPFNTIALTGTGAEATLLIVPNDIDFGTIGVGCSARARTITIYNTGSTPATIDSINLGAPANPAFSVTNLPAFPLTLAPGASTQFDIGFRADAIAAYAGAVEINGTYAGQAVTYVVGLVGRGAVDATQVDNFDQLGRPKVDILWVVDNSCSMFEEQAGLTSNFSAFIQFAEAQRLEYQIAVTTTDVDSGGEVGRFVPLTGTPAERIVTPQTQPSPEAQFLMNASQGTSGSGFEQGLEAAYLALSNPLIFGHNAGFLRQDAVLSIIFLSDEMDQSPSSVDFYTNFFLSIKGFRNTNLFTASAIVGDTPSGCNGAGGNADDGIRYIEVANRTGGIFQSICTSDWSRSLEELSTTAFGFKSRFFLSNQPVVSTIRVYIDGVEIEGTAAGGTVNWTYDYGTNSLNFSPFATPEPGAQIRVEYTVECL